jgi:A/G-specific adenine glycosylase
VPDRRTRPGEPDDGVSQSHARWLPRRLLAWFAEHQRDLPWRRDRDPYRIWVSEVMLQQTQVQTVIPYFERFLTKFPTLAHLAAADEQDVLRLWEGLGYYRRARDLHRSAKRLAADHGGIFPKDPADVLPLPGFGQYTCNAVLSQAFDRRLPILEANSQRVLSRLFGWADDPRQGPARRRLWRAAERLLPRKRVGEFNQALMELGALICTPAAPACSACPLAKRCVANQVGLQEKIPAKSPAPVTVSEREIAVVLWRGEQLLLVQRPAHGRWARLWEVPHAPLRPRETPAVAAARVVRELTRLVAEPGPEILTIRHTITRFQITLLCVEARYIRGTFRSDLYAAAEWVTPADLASYPVSRPQRKLAEALNAVERQGCLF